MVKVIVEREFDTPKTIDALRTVVREGRWCFDQHRVRHLGGYISPDGRRMVCLFEAPDVESVRLLNRTIAMPFTSIWASTVHEPAPPSSAPEG